MASIPGTCHPSAIRRRGDAAARQWHAPGHSHRHEERGHHERRDQSGPQAGLWLYAPAARRRGPRQDRHAGIRAHGRRVHRPRLHLLRYGVDVPRAHERACRGPGRGGASPARLVHHRDQDAAQRAAREGRRQGRADCHLRGAAAASRHRPRGLLPRPQRQREQLRGGKAPRHLRVRRRAEARRPRALDGPLVPRHGRHARAGAHRPPRG